MKKALMLISTFFPSSVRVWLYRCLGCAIGKDARISPFSILVADKINMDAGAYIDPLTMIFSIKSFRVGRGSSVRFGSMVYGHGGGSFAMGDFSTLGLFTLVNCTGSFRAGDYFGTGPRCMIYTHGNFLPTRMGYPNQVADVEAGNYVWLHMNVVVGPGVKMGSNVFIYSMNFIRKNIPDNTSVGPAPECKKFPTALIMAKEKDWQLWDEWDGYVKTMVDMKLWDSARSPEDFVKLDLDKHTYRILRNHPIVTHILAYLNLHKAEYFTKADAE